MRPTAETDLAACLRALKDATRSSEAVLMSCAHTLEGVLCAVGLTYLAHLDASLVRLCSDEHPQPMLGERVVFCPPPSDAEALELAQRVYRGIERTVSAGCPRLRNRSCPSSCEAACVSKLLYASCADDMRMPQALANYVRLAFAQGARIRMLASLPEVVALDELARYTLNECERTRQFLRFVELSNGSFMATFRPQANTLPLVARHFCERMRQDRFCMVDSVHRVAVFHEAGRRSFNVVALDAALAAHLVQDADLAPNERYVQAMWKQFYESLALPGRDASQRGYDLRLKWMPKRFWRDLPELGV